MWARRSRVVGVGKVDEGFVGGIIVRAMRGRLEDDIFSLIEV